MGPTGRRAETASAADRFARVGGATGSLGRRCSVSFGRVVSRRSLEDLSFLRLTSQLRFNELLSSLSLA